MRSVRFLMVVALLVAIPLGTAACATSASSIRDRQAVQTFWGGLAGTVWGLTCRPYDPCPAITPPFTWRL